MAHQDEYYFSIGHVLRQRWQVSKLLGAGAFGQVFLARDQTDHMNVAIKTEKLAVPRKSLCMEVAVMRDIDNCPHVPYIVACGRTDKCRYIVMECLGTALDKVMGKSKSSRRGPRTVPIPLVSQIGLQAITALREVHETGFVHRDVKPANFAFGSHPKVVTNLFIYDFGLARIHLIDKGNGVFKPRRRRDRPGFRGTIRYASLASHHGDDLGRVDDLVPVFYFLIEMAKGKLPWSSCPDRHQVRELKEFTPIEDMCKNLPLQFTRLGHALHGAGYKAQPRYDKLAGLLTSVLMTLGIDPNQRLIIPGVNA